ncbi:hypothetical protein ACOSQ4_006567 [Xanthoceras sorbifolium]
MGKLACTKMFSALLLNCISQFIQFYFWSFRYSCVRHLDYVYISRDAAWIVPRRSCNCETFSTCCRREKERLAGHDARAGQMTKRVQTGSLKRQSSTFNF